MMKDKHIKRVLEENSLRHLSDDQRAVIAIHTKTCKECRKAYQAALMVTELLHTRAGEIVEPTPFFKTRVMAALGEKRAAEKASSFRALWQTTRALIASMVAVVVLLGALTLFSEPAMGSYESSAAESLYSAESVIFDGGNADSLTEGEVLTTLYEPGKEYGDDK